MRKLELSGLPEGAPCGAKKEHATTRTRNRGLLIVGLLTLVSTFALMVPFPASGQDLHRGDLAMLQRVSPENVPAFGTFWSALFGWPLPWDWTDSQAPIYAAPDLGTDCFIVDDSGYDYALAGALSNLEVRYGLRQADSQTASASAGLGSYTSDDLWL